MKTPSQKMAKLFPIGSEFQIPLEKRFQIKTGKTHYKVYVKSCGDLGLDKTNEWDHLCYGRHVCFGTDKNETTGQVFGMIETFTFEQAWRLFHGMSFIGGDQRSRRMYAKIYTTKKRNERRSR